MIYNPEFECMNRSDMESLQLKRLQQTVKNCYENVPHYKKSFDEVGLLPTDIKSLADLQLIPFTNKSDLRDNYPYGLFAKPLKEIVRLHASSGTTGKATVVGYTKNDIDTWSTLIARICQMAGVDDNDVAQVAFGYGLFTGAFGLHYGLEKLGATVVPISSGNSERQINLMKDFGTTTLISTPSYALYLYEVMQKMGISVDELKLKVGLFGGEGLTEAMAKEIENRFNILVTQNYGLSEIIGPGVSGECVCKCGLHINEDHFIPEIIDPITEKVLPMGSVGELVLTAVTKEALPILRYRTHDITSLKDEKCKCGRTLVRMTNVKGRSDDMLIIRGVNIFPSQIETVLVKIKEISPHYEIIVRKDGYMDTIEILVEVLDINLLEKFSELEKLERKISRELKGMLQIEAKVKLVENNSLKRFEGKSKNVTDLRNI